MLWRLWLIIATTAIYNNILADRARSTTPSNPTSANTKSSLDAKSPVKGQPEAKTFEPSMDANPKYNAINPTNNQSSEANSFIDAKSPSNGQREAKASTPSAHENTKYQSSDANSRKSKSPIKRQLEANTFESGQKCRV